jgi:hypothetical protein
MRKYILLTVLTLMSVGAVAATDEIGDSSGSAVRGYFESPTKGEVLRHAREVLLNNPLYAGLSLPKDLFPNMNDLVAHRLVTRN